METEQYKDLKIFSKSVGIPEENLVKAFEIEKIFHHKILNETSLSERKKLYREVYSTVHKIYGKTENDINVPPNPKDYIVKMFAKELKSKSILDVGCGEGYFLASVSRQLNNNELTGIDISIPQKSFSRRDITFIKSDIIEFQTNRKFDIVFADQVLEHIAPADTEIFLNSVKNSLAENGKFILLMPNPLFGPSDVTRIKDFSYTGKTSAEGTHINELKYCDLVPLLKKNGFSNFKMPIMIPKIKMLLRNVRISPFVISIIEKSKLIMNILYSIKYKGHPLFKFETILICSFRKR